MKILSDIWKKLVSAKKAVVNFFTDGNGYIGQTGFGKATIIEMAVTTAMFLVPMPLHPAVAFPIRIGIPKVITLILHKNTFMKCSSSVKSMQNAIIICAASLVVVTLAVYGFNLSISTIILGAVMNLLFTFN